jgi:hypothetical protein
MLVIPSFLPFSRYCVLRVTGTYRPEPGYKHFTSIFWVYGLSIQLHSFETLVHKYQTTRCHSPEDHSINILRSIDYLVHSYTLKLHETRA